MSKRKLAALDAVALMEVYGEAWDVYVRMARAIRDPETQVVTDEVEYKRAVIIWRAWLWYLQQHLTAKGVLPTDEEVRRTIEQLGEDDIDALFEKASI